MLVLNLVAVRLFGETEFWLTLLKVGAIVAMVVLGVGLLVSGAGLPTGQPSVTHLWEHGGFAPHGTWGILLSLTVVVLAFGGIETVGLTAAESQNPHRSIPGAINTVPWRILLFYVGSVGVMLTLAPWTGITGEQSPFVQIIDAVGLPAAAHVLNAVVIIAAFSALNAITFAIGRTLFGLAAAGHAPAVFGRVSGRGVPGAAHRPRRPAPRGVRHARLALGDRARGRLPGARAGDDGLPPRGPCRPGGGRDHDGAPGGAGAPLGTPPGRLVGGFTGGRQVKKGSRSPRARVVIVEQSLA